MKRLLVLLAAVLAGCGKFELGAPALDYEVVTRTQCLTTTADRVFIARENYWWNTGRIVEVHFTRDHQEVMYVPGEEFIMYREIRKEER